MVVQKIGFVLKAGFNDLQFSNHGSHAYGKNCIHKFDDSQMSGITSRGILDSKWLPRDRKADARLL